MKYILIISVFCLICSCKEKNKIEVGKLDAVNTYTVDEIGWRVHVPSGWDILTREQLKRNTEKGKEAMESAIEMEIDASRLQQLLNLSKDKFNSFLSTMEKYDNAELDSYQKNNRNVNDMLKQTYESKGIYAEYHEDTVRIDGLLFNVFKSKIYAPDKQQVILNQAMYSRLINGYDVGMTINYNNETAKNELEKMLFSSTFSKRD